MPSAHRVTASLRIVAVIAITATALTAVATASAGGSSSRTAATTCPRITATPWVAPQAPYPKGSQYYVAVGKGWTCQRADVYIRKLVASKVQGTFPTIVKGGPPGWVCTASKSKSGLAYSGQCAPSAAARFIVNGPGFSWTVG